MRAMLGILASCLLSLAPTHASAAIFANVGIFGTVTGTKTTILCNSGSPLSCLSENPGGIANTPYINDFSVFLGTMNLAQGDNDFSWGHPRVSGSWSGIINNDDGYLTGRNLQFAYEDSNARFGAIGSSYIFASASTFNVVGGIPEPATWALMLMGFLAVGTALRQAPRRTLLPA